MRLAVPVIGLLRLRADALVVEEWFLTEDEIIAESCSVNRSSPPGGYPGLQAWTSGNVVTFIPDGNAMFTLLGEEIDGLGAGDAMYGAGWTLAPDLDLHPDPATHKHGLLYDCVDDDNLQGACSLFGLEIGSCVLETILGQDMEALDGADLSHACCNSSLANLGSCSSAAGVIARANERGAAVKLMIWANEVIDTTGGPYLVYGQERMNHFFQEVPSSESIMILDGRTHDEDTTSIKWGGFSSLWPRSLHTKHYSFLDNSSGVRSAFVGGIDVAACRNDATDASRRLSITGDCAGWLDQAVKLEGPAAADVANSFVQQYNWKGDLVASQSKGDAGKFDAIWAQELGAAAPKASAGGTQHVQVLRTFACDAGRPFVKGPDGCTGEYTILAAVLKAIKRAEKFIFIEDQYGFDVPPIHSALSDALDRGVKVFAMMNAISDEGTNRYCGDNVAEMWGDLRDKGALVYEYNAADAHKDYVHSKTWIVDDCWFMTGSANLNWRSMTLDTELSVAVMDDTCDSWVKEVRCQMWSELANDISASSICAMPSSTASQVRSVVNTIWGSTGEQTTKLKEMELGSGDSWTDWFTSEEKYLQSTCDWLDQDGRCPTVDALANLASGPRLAAAVVALAPALHLAF